MGVGLPGDNPAVDNLPSPTAWVDSSGTLHDPGKLLFFIKEDFLGEAAFDPGSHPATGYRRFGAALFCPDCGDIWARVVLLNSKGEQAPFLSEQVACHLHPDQWNVPGSILANRLEGLLPILPAAVLTREFLIHLNREGTS